MSDKIYVPDTDQVRHAGVSTYTYKQFDLWLASVKAEAWEEGAEAAFYNPEIRGLVDYPDENPYRAET